LAPFGGTPGAISRKIFNATTHCGPHLYIFQVSSKAVPVWGSHNRKTLPQPSKLNAIKALGAYKYTVSIPDR